MTGHWPLIGVACLHVALSAFVYRANPTSPINRWFAAYTVSLAAWTVGIATVYSVAPAWFGGRLSFAAASLIPATFLELVDHYPSRSRPIGATVRKCVWITAIFFSIISFTTSLVGARFIVIDGVLIRDAGGIYPVFAVYFIGASVFAAMVLVRKWRETRGLERSQLSTFLGAIVVSVTGATTANLFHPLVTGQSTYAWLGPYFGLSFVAIIAHAIIRHRFMDLRLVVHRSLTLTIATIVSVIPVAAILFLLGPRLAIHLGLHEIALGSLAILLVALTVPFTHDAASHLLDRYVYRRRANFQRTVRDASGELTRILQVRILARFMEGVIADAIECEGIALYLRRGPVFCRQGDEWRHTNGRFEAPSDFPPVIAARLSLHGDIIVADALSEEPCDHGAPSLSTGLSRLNWALVLPTMSENHVIGAIVLGPKRSGDPYYPQDLDLLMTLANQAGIAIKNAQLYAQVVLANEHLENILGTVTSGVVAVDADGVISMFNHAAEQLTGLAHERAYAQPLAALPALLADALAGTLRDGAARTQPDIDLSDGTITRPIMCMTSPLRDPDGALLGAVAVFSDLTSVRALEIERRRVERLAYLETFASGIAHEVKNPLVAIKAFAQLLPRRRSDEAFIDEFSRIVTREIARMERLIERLRTLSRPGQRARRVLDVRQPLVDALEFMQPSFEDKDVLVEAALGEIEAPVTGDAGELEQLFLNLLMNANEATPRGGRIAVAVLAGNGRVAVAVADTGPGIPEDALGRVFNPFFTTKERGSGLGLAISAGIADTHGARLRAENVPTGGARFTVEFPLTREIPAPVTA